MPQTPRVIVRAEIRLAGAATLKAFFPRGKN
jgi:hypothetical protein